MFIVLFCLMFLTVNCQLEEKRYVWDTKIRNRPVFTLKRDQYRIVGQNLQVNCSLRNADHPVDINRLRIVHCPTGNRSHCDDVTLRVDNKTVAVIRYNISLGDTGTYFCQYRNRADTEDNFHLKIGCKPVGPDLISCISIDMNDLACSWNMSEKDLHNPLPVWYKSSFFARPQYGEFDCPHPEPVVKQNEERNDISCSIPPSSAEAKITFSKYNNYTLFINATNKCASHETPHEIVLKEIVKLSPPNIAVLNVTDRTINLEMNLPLNTRIALSYLKNITYSISYSSEYSRDTISFHSNKNQSIDKSLQNLIPYTFYTITIRSKGPDSQYWSDAHIITRQTTAAAPVAIPDIGGYSINDESFLVYIRPILKLEKNSANAFYQVTVESAFSIVQRLNVTWDKTMIENIDIMPHDNSSFRIKIWTANDIGRSLDNRAMTIHAYDKDRQIPTNVVVEQSGMDYFISWSRKNTYDDTLYTALLYWCRGKNMVCEYDLNWMNASNDQKIVRVKIDQDGKWIFAVAYQYFDGYITEMVFSQCYFPSIKDQPLGIARFSVIPISKREVQVKPGEFCSNKYLSRPLKYTVYYKAASDGIESCDTTFHTKTVSANIETNTITLDDLDSDTNYSVCLGVTTKGGWNITSNPQNIRTMHPGKEEVEYTLIIGVLAAVLIIVLFFCLIRNRWKKYKDIDTHIDVPKIYPKNNYMKAPGQDNDALVQYNRQESSLLHDSGISSGLSRMNSNQSNQPTNITSGVQKFDQTLKNIYNTVSSEETTGVTDVSFLLNDTLSRMQNKLDQTSSLKRKSRENLQSSDDRLNMYSLNETSDEITAYAEVGIEGSGKYGIVCEKSPETLRNKKTILCEKIISDKEVKEINPHVGVENVPSQTSEGIRLEGSSSHTGFSKELIIKSHTGVVSPYVQVNDDGSVKSDAVNKESNKNIPQSPSYGENNPMTSKNQQISCSDVNISVSRLHETNDSLLTESNVTDKKRKFSSDLNDNITFDSIEKNNSSSSTCSLSYNGFSLENNSSSYTCPSSITHGTDYFQEESEHLKDICHVSSRQNLQESTFEKSSSVIYDGRQQIGGYISNSNLPMNTGGNLNADYRPDSDSGYKTVNSFGKIV